MEYLKSLLTNRISIATAVIHWILFFLLLVALIGSTRRIFYPDFKNALTILFYASDIPAGLISFLIWSPYYFIDMPEVFRNGAIATSFFTITLQWLIIGKLFSQIIDRRKQKVIEVSIFDAN